MAPLYSVKEDLGYVYNLQSPWGEIPLPFPHPHLKQNIGVCFSRPLVRNQVDSPQHTFVKCPQHTFPLSCPLFLRKYFMDKQLMALTCMALANLVSSGLGS